jgi:hypothetical protein
MEIRFDMIRIGKFRKNYISEILLKQNVNGLKNSIKSLLLEIDNIEINLIHIVMIIPAKGFSIKISLKNINNKHIREIIKQNFSNCIFKGKYSIIMDNLNNPIFKN